MHKKKKAAGTILMKLKIQPIIHLRNKPGYRRGKYPGLLCKCIVGCIFNSVGLKYPVYFTSDNEPGGI
jgi:hypothetical protein